MCVSFRGAGVVFAACQKIVQAPLASSGVLIGRSNTPNHVGPVVGPAVRSYHTQQSGPPLPPHPSAHGGSGGGKSFDAQSHSSSGSGNAAPPPLTPTGMTAGHVRVHALLTARLLVNLSVFALC